MARSTPSTRREFLQGKAAADALVDAASGIAPGSGADLAAAVASQGTYLLRLSRSAMACEFELFFNAGQYPHAAEAGLAALDLVDRLEDQLSVFREHSEISRLNRHAADEPMAVEPPLFALLELAVEISRSTCGAYDITSGPLSRVWGFTRRAGKVPADSALTEALARVGSQHLQFDSLQHSVRFEQAGVEINLGSIGKGYALDRCAELFAAVGIHDALLHGGASSVLARGTHGALPNGEGWLVGVRDPLRPRRRLGQLRVRDRALATSGTGVQFFTHDERRYGHILDPRSGRPAEGVLSTTVLAPTAAEADALSTAFYVMGPTAVGEYCAARPDLAAIVLCPAAREGGLERHMFGLDQADWIEGDTE
ncbi:MAG: FAD:protein FMN transferase [Pirellulales bacterium]